MSKRKTEPFNNPFAALGSELKKDIKKSNRQRKKEARLRWVKPSAPPAAREAAKPEAPSDEDLFAQAVAGAERMEDPRGVVTPPLPPPDARDLPVYDEEAEALAELASLVDGSMHFDISDSDEFIEGCMEGLDRRVLQKLRRGDFAHRGHLDLHGMNREQARAAVEQFIVERKKYGHRCVLIVHGRGHNSKDQIPVLKVALKAWLERGRIAKSVMAFCTARPHDGGAGAMYVLLRK